MCIDTCTDMQCCVEVLVLVCLWACWCERRACVRAYVRMRVCVRRPSACVRVCVRASVRACGCVRVCGLAGGKGALGVPAAIIGYI